MQLGGAPRLPASTDVPSALRAAAAALGQRPAVTVLRADGRRDEQGFASLLQWTAKGAHLLELDWLLAPGGRLAVVGPAGWLPAAVCLAAWWVGAEVAVAADGGSLAGGSLDGVELAVVHEGVAAPAGVEILWWGDAVDGTRTGAGMSSPTAGDDWAIAVQTMPDQPPPPRGQDSSVAVVLPGRAWTQRELLAAIPAQDVEGPVGCSVAAEPGLWLPAFVRSMVTGRPTVLLAGASREHAAGDRVRTWLD